MKLKLTMLIALMLAAVHIGCIGDPANPSATQPATDIDPATTQPSYWYSQPATTIRSRDFDHLWDTCDQVAHDFLFSTDRTDYRGGVLTTKPMTSRQWFEFWRPDVRTLADLRRTTIACTRRTIRFEFTRLPDNTYTVATKVLVERESIAEQRVTSVTSYQGVFRRPIRTRDQPTGTHESDEGVVLPYHYWYPIGRDPALEAVLVDAIKDKL